VRLLAFAVGMIAVAGCLAPGPQHRGTSLQSVVGGPSPRLAELGALAPGCDANRTAVPHLAGGVPAPGANLRLAPLPCLMYTGEDGTESNIGIAPDGSVFYYPAQDSLPTPATVGQGLSVMRSDDAGAHWVMKTPTIGPVPTHPNSLDPQMYLDPVTGRIFAEDLVFSPNCGSLSRSDDGGDSWTEGVSGCLEFDHVSYAAGPAATSPVVGYRNVVYRCGINVVATTGGSTTGTCQKSLDGGTTWLPPGEPAFQYPTMPPTTLSFDNLCDGDLGHIAVDWRGWLFVPKGYCGEPWLAISKDEGTTWKRVQVSELGMPIDNAGFKGHEAGIGIDPAGNLYYAWVAHDRLPYLAVSRDGGITWDKPRMIGLPGAREAALGELAVGGVGKLAFVSMESRDSEGWVECVSQRRDCLVQPMADRPYRNVTWDGVMTVTWNALDPNATFWSANLNPVGDPLVRGACGPLRCQEAFDYLDVRIGPDGTPWASLVDGCTGSCAKPGATTDNDNRGIAGRFWGGASLWDTQDPNGPYP